MASNSGATASVSEALKVLEAVARQSPNLDLQKHALSLIRDLDIFRELKQWSNDITSSNKNAASKAEALVNLRVVGSMALKYRDHGRNVQEVHASHGDNGSSSSTIPSLMDFTPTDGTFDSHGGPQPSPIVPMSPNKYFSDPNHPSSPIPKRKSLTVRQATHLANIRRNSRDMGKQAEKPRSESDAEGNNDSNLLGLLRKTLNVQEAPSPPNTAPNTVLKEKKGPDWVKVGAWYMDLNDEENARMTPFLRATNTIAKIMDSPSYSINLKAAEQESKAKELDPTKHTPAVISALFATNPTLATSLWDSGDQDTIKSTVLEAPTGLTEVPIMQAAPKSRNSSEETYQTPEIKVTDASDRLLKLTETLGAGRCFDQLPSFPTVLGLQSDVPYRATLPLAPVPTHPQTFKYTPTPIPRSIYVPTPVSSGGIVPDGEEIDFDEFIPKFQALMAKNQTSHTIPKTHDNPLIAAELALLHAQTILPQGCNPEFKEICPCELSGRECPFKVTCFLKRCYHKSEADHPQSVHWMHPNIRPSCVAWLRGDENCGHTGEEKAHGEFGHDEKVTRKWQGSDSRVRLHLAWNI